MIMCLFDGEMGNNMFQVAALLGVAIPNEYKWCIPKFRSGYGSSRTIEIPTLFEYNYPWWDGVTIPEIYKHPDIAPDPARNFGYVPLPVQDNIAYKGFFQSEKYFKHIEEDLRNVYFKEPDYLRSYHMLKYSELKGTPTVSIHVRRGGDRPWVQHNHKDLDPGYYVDALYKVYERDERVAENIVVFSDDIPWCRDVFDNKDHNMIFIENESAESDLWLMSKCTHNIIANSTFSWWAAWLNTNPDKIVVAPDEGWFGPGLQHLDRSDLFPDGWITI